MIANNRSTLSSRGQILNPALFHKDRFASASSRNGIAVTYPMGSGASVHLPGRTVFVSASMVSLQTTVTVGRNRLLTLLFPIDISHRSRGSRWTRAVFTFLSLVSSLGAMVFIATASAYIVHYTAATGRLSVIETMFLPYPISTPAPVETSAPFDLDFLRREVSVMVREVTLEQPTEPENEVSQRDYAIGALVIPDLTSSTSGSLTRRQTLSLQLGSLASGFDLISYIGSVPSKALDSQISEGSCWKFVGSYGYLGIRLQEAVAIDKITIDHVPREVASSSSLLQAPREMILWGLVDGMSADEELAQQSRSRTSARHPNYDFPLRPVGLAETPYVYVPLTKFSYKVAGTAHIQTFPIGHRSHDGRMAFNTVLLEILTNHGAESTCVYRVGLYGEPVKSLVVYEGKP